MTREFLERLYWACTAGMSTDADGTRLSEFYERTEETGKVDHLFSEKLYAVASLPNKEKNLLDNLDGSVAIAYEKQGFINGFRLGMKLAGELKGGAEDGR